jgi:Zn-dependent alcohol dehydrogenase
MIDNPDAWGGIGGYGAALVGGALVMKAFDFALDWRKSRASTAAEVGLIERLNDRIVHLESRQAVLEAQVNSEIALRLAAQETASALRQRVAVLEGVIETMGGQVPPEET